MKFLPKPNSKGDLKKLLGRLGFFRCFVPNFATKVAPLQKLLKKHVRFEWKEEFSAILQNVANEIINAELVFPKDSELSIECDASKVAVGAVLKADGKLVKCYSEILGHSQKQWSNFEKELYAVRQALRSFERIIGGKRVVVRTDNQAVAKFLSGGGELATKPIRIREWVSDLLARDFSVKWIKGTENALADSLSRLQETNDVKKQVMPQNSHCDVEEIKERGDRTVKSSRSSERKTRRAYKMEKKIVATANRKVPQVEVSKESVASEESFSTENKKNLLRQAHRSHGGVGAMLLNLKETKWENMVVDVKKYVSNCFYCKSKRAPTKNALRGLQVGIFGELVCLDSFKWEGFWVVLAVDYVSGFLQLLECDHPNSETAKNCLMQIMALLGKPEKVLTDNGTEFRGVFDEFLTEMEIKHLRTAVNHPQANNAERKIQEVKKLLNILRNQGEEFNLHKVAMLLNHQRSTVSGYSPTEIVTGMTGLGIMQLQERKLTTMEDRMKNVKTIAEIREKRRAKINQKLDNRNFDKNDLVWIYDSNSLLLGVIEEKLHHNCYMVDMDGGKRKISGDILLHCGEA